MNWEPIRVRLSHILNCDVIQKTIPRSLWKTSSIIFELDNEIVFVLDSDEQELIVFSVPQIFMTESEKSLVELLIEQYKQLYLSDPTTPDQPSWLRMRTWIIRQLDEQNFSVVLPETLFPSERLNEQWLPLLLQITKSEENIDHDYKELKNLLDSFFDVETILIPMYEHEWLVLVSVSLLFESEDDGLDGTSSTRQEEALESFGYGLNEMFTNEWIGDCQMAVGRPMNPRTELIQTIEQLRHCVLLGKKYRPEEELYFPWRMQLEWLLDQINHRHVNRFLEQTLNIFNKQQLDGELIQTLEQFFEENCNVSETAKKLYIHRNTLIYRLDKFKQETGMDVRNFRHAVLVQIAILLYKVTKH